MAMPGTNELMPILIDELRLIELKKLFARTQAHQLGEFVRVFRETSKAAVKALVDASADTPLDDLRTEAHRLKGASLNIGAPALAELASSLELKAKRGDRAVFETRRYEISTLHNETLKELKEVLMRIG